MSEQCQSAGRIYRQRNPGIQSGGVSFNGYDRSLPKPRRGRRYIKARRGESPPARPQMTYGDACLKQALLGFLRLGLYDVVVYRVTLRSGAIAKTLILFS